MYIDSHLISSPPLSIRGGSIPTVSNSVAIKILVSDLFQCHLLCKIFGMHLIIAYTEASSLCETMLHVFSIQSLKKRVPSRSLHMAGQYYDPDIAVIH